jgi:hypothetical protein
LRPDRRRPARRQPQRDDRDRTVVVQKIALDAFSADDVVF